MTWYGRSGMECIWVLVVGRDRAKVLEAQDPQLQLRECSDIKWHETLDHPLEESVVVKPEVQAQAVLHRHAGTSSADPKMTAFAVQINAHLERELKNGTFQRLILMAPEETLVLLKAALGPEVRKVVALDVEADLIDEDAAIIRANLPEMF